MIAVILLIFLIVVFFATIPVWPYSRQWGYAPGGGTGTILLIVVLLLALHVI